MDSLATGQSRNEGKWIETEAFHLVEVSSTGRRHNFLQASELAISPLQTVVSVTVIPIIRCADAPSDIFLTRLENGLKVHMSVARKRRTMWTLLVTGMFMAYLISLCCQSATISLSVIQDIVHNWRSWWRARSYTDLIDNIQIANYSFLFFLFLIERRCVNTAAACSSERWVRISTRVGFLL